MTDGLVGYWNGRIVNDNIAPDLSKNDNQATLTNLTTDTNGFIFNGVGNISIPVPNEMKTYTDGTLAFIVKLVSDLETDTWAILVGDELTEQSYLFKRTATTFSHVHSGIFDTNNTDRFYNNAYVTNLGGVTNEYYITYRYNDSTRTLDTLIINMDTNVQYRKSFIVESRSLLVEGNRLIFGELPGDDNIAIDAHINSIILYNRYLTDDEIIQNVTAGHEVGVTI